MSTPLLESGEPDSAPNEWLEVSFCVAEPLHPTLEAALWTEGALAISRSDAGDTPVYEPKPGVEVSWPEVRISALFPLDQDLMPVLLTLRYHLGDAADQVNIQKITEQPWEELWRLHAKPVQFGGRLWIIPEDPHNVPTPPPGPTVFLTPGLGFGTGTHPTTRLCLQYLAEHPPVGETLIDFGSGSGILSLAALALGAQQVYAVDHDPQALESTRANAEINGFTSTQLRCFTSDQPLPTQTDWIIANILATVLMDLKETFKQYLKPRGRLVMSGILREQVTELLQQYENDWVLCEKREEEEWVLVVLERRLSSPD